MYHSSLFMFLQFLLEQILSLFPKSRIRIDGDFIFLLIQASQFIIDRDNWFPRANLIVIEKGIRLSLFCFFVCPFSSPT